jgi:hypothetical protein
MSTSQKTPASIRQGGPGSSHENAKAPLDLKKPASDDSDNRSRSRVSGGGGEKDSHHTHESERKGGGSRPAD